ncbi:putative RNA-directed DNA polymerase from transposon X-element [Stylophora pistillata]|uniref:Putative RNA-directed DNA polymerase from transposon X-element n=1 Tax=Stylophora pistillata TaxID=50429 RepID=A0A2B4R3L6_STYPI|nr:putative RNA-directed DNA polymerase from transposon X-element [Stylophora pistillata]
MLGVLRPSSPSSPFHNDGLVCRVQFLSLSSLGKQETFPHSKNPTPRTRVGDLFNKSLRLGTLPEDWKLANVVPAYQKDHKDQGENYRPISLLPIVSKVLERCIFNNIKDHVLSLIAKCQHGFIAGRSCVTQLVGAYLDNGGQVDIIYLDMSKAFDKVSHHKLLQKSAPDCPRGPQSAPECPRVPQSVPEGPRGPQRAPECPRGPQSAPEGPRVPQRTQGSILGPMLFLLYANSLPDVVHSSQNATFADDIKIFKAIKSPCDSKDLQEDLSNLVSWPNSAGLPFNYSKCKAQRVTRKVNPVRHNYQMGGTDIEITKEEKDLGVLVTDDLT